MQLRGSAGLYGGRVIVDHGVDHRAGHALTNTDQRGAEQEPHQLGAHGKTQEADTEHDPHSPQHAGFIWSHIGWFFSSEAFSTNYKAVSDLAKFPELVWLNRYDIIAPFILLISLYVCGEYLYSHAPEMQTSGIQLVVWGFFISTVGVFHATSSINSLSHQWGSRDFDTPDQSRNNFFLALITLGEGWHNNHHFYPNSVRQGFRWWQIDVTFYMLWLLSKIGIIHELRPVDMKRGTIR